MPVSIWAWNAGCMSESTVAVWILENTDDASPA